MGVVWEIFIPVRDLGCAVLGSGGSLQDKVDDMTRRSLASSFHVQRHTAAAHVERESRSPCSVEKSTTPPGETPRFPCSVTSPIRPGAAALALRGRKDGDEWMPLRTARLSWGCRARQRPNHHARASVARGGADEAWNGRGKGWRARRGVGLARERGGGRDGDGEVMVVVMMHLSLATATPLALARHWHRPHRDSDRMEAVGRGLGASRGDGALVGGFWLVVATPSLAREGLALALVHVSDVSFLTLFPPASCHFGSCCARGIMSWRGGRELRERRWACHVLLASIHDRRRWVVEVGVAGGRGGGKWWDEARANEQHTHVVPRTPSISLWRVEMGSACYIHMCRHCHEAGAGLDRSRREGDWFVPCLAGSQEGSVGAEAWWDGMHAWREN
ncbi:hypothetical protein BJ875DRAFT_444521 [Amylocarpus encephaloides]|uniref:Uncharacterized protein n=1 Tax=Amylocarpus encephaloides TaxID=45428 RepID=A0A9P7YCU2_9HELO|nr:hypothetical protein BJ875DRAFT_444521 [Amylocarpus encephaloides]